MNNHKKEGGDDFLVWSL